MKRAILQTAAVLALSAGIWAQAVAVAAEPFVSQGNVPDETGIALVTVADGLEHPWGLDWLPDGSALVTERAGDLHLIRIGLPEPMPISGVPAVFAAGQGGLLDIAVHPEFADNGLVYLSYAAGDRGANRTQVARGVLDGSVLRDLEVIFAVADTKAGAQHFGSRLLWLPDGTLLVSIGDGGNPPVAFDGQAIRLQAQNPGTHFGSLIRIHDDGSIPSDNPVVGGSDAQPEIWSYGHRNVQGLALDPVTGVIWANEHGARRGDELNRVEVGENYGWPQVTHSRNYGLGSLISPHTSLPGMVDPTLVWMTTVAPSGLVVYRGDVFPEWDGDLLSGGLVSQDIRRIDLDGNGIVIGETSIGIDARVRDVSVSPDGHVYVLTDESDGALIRLDPQ